MAWRIANHVVRGEIDSRVRGRVTGNVWVAGRKEPLVLDLEGNPLRDLAGHRLRFSNPEAVRIPEDWDGLTDRQAGAVGDMTASRIVRVPECSAEELHQRTKAGKPFPWHWGNALYLEWFSETNGRVVIESTDFEIELEPHGSWEMSEDDETTQLLANSRALTGFMDRLANAVGRQPAPGEEPVDDDEPQSEAEAEADAEAARRDLLLDRVTARLEREGNDPEKFEQILDEERRRLRRERGEPEVPEPTPEEQAEREARLEAINAAADEAVAELEAERWKENDSVSQRRWHPLVGRCSDLSIRIRREIQTGGWISEDAQREHPLLEIIDSCAIAGAKLAGALGAAGEEEWPPNKLFAGDTLVRLKKARSQLRDAIRGLDSADEENLATARWRIATRREIGEILGRVQELIDEVRQVLADEAE